MTGLIRRSFRFGPRGSRRDRRGAFIGTMLVLSLAIGSFAGPIAVAEAASSCVSSGPASNAYSVNVCITAPADGATVGGQQTMTATVSVTGTNPGVSKTVFYLRGAYLLTGYASPYSYKLTTTDFVDGLALLEVEADMRDGFASQKTSINLTFNNGITSPPVNTNTWSPKTPPATGAGGALIVAAVGDGASGEPNETTATTIIHSWNPDMFLYLGDVYEKGTLAEFRNFYDDGSKWYGEFKARTNPVIGNHEYEGNAAPGYFNFWDNAPHYYSYNDNGWHFIALDSTSQFNQTLPGSAQYTWLQNDLRTNAQPCTLVYFHHPTFSVGPQGDTTRMDQMWQLFNSWGVDLVLNGHEHEYQRWLPLDGSGNPSPGGPTEIIAGTGGHGMQSFVKSDSRMVKGFDSSPGGIGALRLALTPGGATYQFQTAAGVQDSGTISCTPAAPDTTPPTKPGNLTATPLGANRVDLSWTAATDNVGVVAYDISRGGQFLTSIAGSSTSYADTSVSGSTTYTYTVSARDLAGNSGPASDAAQATTGSGSGTPVFADDFESGTLTGWTNTGMVAQGQEVYAGSWAARATTTSVADWAWHTIPTETDAYYRLRFKIVSLGANNVYLMKVRTGTGTSIGGLYVDTSNTLNLRNDAGAVTVRSPRSVSLGAWHELQVHWVIGSSGQIETWLDGTKVNELSQTANFGTTAVGRLQIADNSGSRAFDLAIDDVAVANQFISSGPPSDTSPPSTPGNVNANAVSSGQVNLSWNPSLDNVGVVGYDIFRNADYLDSVVGSSATYSDSSVDAGTTYSYTVQAKDAAGNVSAQSAAAVATTPATAPGAPTALQATGSAGQVALSWTAPVATGGANITNYKIYRGTTSGGESATPVATIGNLTNYTDTTVQNGTTYYYTVAAVNSAGTSAQSNEAVATPANTVTVPGAPQNLTATAGNQHVQLSWAPPVSNGGATITAYTVYRGTTSGSEPTTVTTTNGSTTSYDDNAPSLTNGTTYYYVVTATNSQGEGGASNEASATPATGPDAPTNLNATASPGQVVLSWTAPLNTGGSSITGYQIWRGTTSGGETLQTSVGNVTGYTDSGLANGTTYYYEVKAVNSAAASGFSNEAVATPITTAGAPTGLTASPGDTTISLSWTAPASNGGSAITAYKIYRGTSPSGETLLTTTADATPSFGDTGLTNGTTYYYKVAAVNGAGDGTQSGEASATPATAPGQPTGLTATAGNASVSLQWTAPLNDGGSAITGYKIYRSTTTNGEGTTPVATVGNVLTYNDTGRTNGTTYYYKVAAVNAAATGSQSDEASATPITNPGAPTGLTATGGDAQVSLSWTAPASNGGSAITNYKIYRSTTAGGEGTTPFATVPNVLTYNDTAVTNGTTYFYKVAAVTSFGTGGQSSEASATPGSVPGAPGSLVAAGNAGSIGLTWTAAAGNGSSVTNYKIYRGTSSGGEASTAIATVGNVLAYTDSSVAAGTTYFYKVSAVNGVGEGSQSNEANAAPTAAPPLLTEGFEAPLSGWTVVGPFTRDSTVPVKNGTFVGRDRCAGSACWAWKPLASSSTDVWAQAWVFVQTADKTTTNLFKLRTNGSGSGGAVFGLLINNKGKLSSRNDVAAKTTTGLTTFPTGGWHLLTVHLTLGTSGHVDVWLDGVKDTTLSKNDNFGTTPIGKLQLGENGSGRNFEVRYDDITVSASALTP